MGKKIGHLNIIQTTIGRLAKNSFTIKSWNITLLTGLIAYTFSNDSAKYLEIFITAVMFTFILLFIDSYYLYLERAYRGLYQAVAGLEEDRIDFTMVFHGEEKPEYIKTEIKPLEGLFRWINLFYVLEIIVLCILFLPSIF